MARDTRPAQSTPRPPIRRNTSGMICEDVPTALLDLMQIAEFIDITRKPYRQNGPFHPAYVTDDVFAVSKVDRDALANTWHKPIDDIDGSTTLGRIQQPTGHP
jgi:hypothetical protein